MVTALGTDGECVESAALAAGWTSKKGGYDSLRHRTGVTPTAVRELSQAELDGLAASLMICGRGARRCTGCVRLDCVCCPRHHARDNYPVHLRLRVAASERWSPT
jgi:hypothetical protein